MSGESDPIEFAGLSPREWVQVLVGALIGGFLLWAWFTGFALAFPVEVEVGTWR